jgi:hypothetical protein
MMRRSIFLLLALVACASTLRAQGSSYNFIGFGMPGRSADPAIEALGGAGAALRGSRTINDLNPADWTWLTRARFGVGIDFNYNSSQLADISETQHDFGFQGLKFGVPFWSQQSAAFALGYVPLTTASGKLVSSDSLAQQTSVRKGGANMLFAGFAIRPISAIALGARADLITGNIRHQIQLTPIGTVDSAEYERDYIFNGLRPTFGIQLIGDSLSDGLHGLTIGASFSLAASLSSTRETIITPTLTTLDTTIDEGSTGKYPSSLLAGISYEFSRRYKAEVDYAAQNFENTYAVNETDPTRITAFGATTRISVGVERYANVGGEYGTSFGLDKWALRLGFSYGQLPYTTRLGAATLSELALSVGAGIPLGSETMLDIALTAGQRSPGTSSAPKENFIRLGAGVSLSDRWFVPLRRE